MSPTSRPRSPAPLFLFVSPLASTASLSLSYRVSVVVVAAVDLGEDVCVHTCLCADEVRVRTSVRTSACPPSTPHLSLFRWALLQRLCYVILLLGSFILLPPYLPFCVARLTQYRTHSTATCPTHTHTHTTHMRMHAHAVRLEESEAYILRPFNVLSSPLRQLFSSRCITY